jgi:hypothetical protein
VLAERALRLQRRFRPKRPTKSEVSPCERYLIGTQQVAWLHVTTLSNQSSAFLNLDLDNTVGMQPEGKEVRNFAAQSGHLVIIGEEPLLEAGFDTSQAPTVMIYAKPGSTVVWETAPAIGPEASWTPHPSITMTNLWVQLPAPPNVPQQFYRARRE